MPSAKETDAPVLLDRFLAQFKMIRNVATPIVGIETPDPLACIERLMGSPIPGTNPPSFAIAPSSPVLVWDAIRGLRHANKPGEEAINKLISEMPKAMQGMDIAQATSHPVDMLTLIQKAPRTTCVFMLNAHRFLGESGVQGLSFMQAIWNLRNPFKQILRTLVLMGPAISLPPELTNDVTMLDEPLPSDADLQGIALGVLESGGRAQDANRIPRAVDALRGLSAFAAEQATALATDRDTGLDVDQLWDRKRRMIASTPGLSVWRGGETFADIGGCAQIKRFAQMILSGKNPPRVILFMDEVEKMMAGASGIGDNTGVAQGQHQKFLSWSEDTGATGMLFNGPPGACKTQLAKAIAAEAKIPCVQFDFGGMKAKHLGESEGNTNSAFKIVDAVGGGRVLMIATCNRMVSLSPEFKRRFKMGTFYFDLLTDAERPIVWDIYRRIFSIGAKQRTPPDSGWTGAEIKQACFLADTLRIPLIETSQFIVPVCRSAAEEIRQLRQQAHGRYLSASEPGYYQAPSEQAAEPLEPAVGRRGRAVAEV